MIREIATRFTKGIAIRRAAARKKVTAAVRVRFAPMNGLIGHMAASEKLSLSGATIDISSSGIAFIVPSIRINENYLVGQNRLLIVELDIHDRTVIMKVIGRRYEEVGEHLSTRQFLVGAEIVELAPIDRVAYEYFVEHARKLAKPPGDVLELGRLD